jgi:hypothetical protein
MSNSEIEIVVDDPTAPEADSPAVTSTRVADVTVSLLLLALAATLGFDNWRTGIAWDSTGPEAGYFPFYLSVILGGASLYGLVTAFLARKEASETFVTACFILRYVMSGNSETVVGQASVTKTSKRVCAGNDSTPFSPRKLSAVIPLPCMSHIQSTSSR